MNFEKRDRPVWPLWLAAFTVLTIAILLVLSSAAANERGPDAVAVETPGFMPVVLRPLPSATPTVTPTATSLPGPPPNAVIADPYACCFDTSAITDVKHAGDERLFVLQREGVVRIVRPGGSVQSLPFLDIKHLVTNNYWEEGLLGIAFHPNYVNNGYFYVTFTLAGTEAVVLYRFERMADDPNQADLYSGVRLMTIEKPSEVHHGGEIQFGPDGYLYFGVGDGGPDPVVATSVPGDPNNHSQRLDEALGNILRIDVDSNGGTPPDLCTNGAGYTVPADNPFVDGPGGTCDEVWAYGFRNPWRFSFDRLTNDLYISDVGEWHREEVNVLPAGTGAGQNFGWHCWEGSLDYRLLWPQVASHCQGSDYVMPQIERDHVEGDCSIIGGYVYRGSLIPGLQGHYVFGDYCKRQVMRASAADGWQEKSMLQTLIFMTTFGEDIHGELYLGGWNNSTLYRIEPVP